MKTLIFKLLCGISLLLSFEAYTQSTAPNNNWVAANFLGWNNTNGINPLFFRTNALDRMKINGTLNYTVNGFNAARNGYVLMGVNNNSLADGQNIYTQKGAFSLLHLNGEGETYKKERRLPQKQLSNQFVIFVHKQHILWH